jgi:hypothetical protein
MRGDNRPTLGSPPALPSFDEHPKGRTERSPFQE